MDKDKPLPKEPDEIDDIDDDDDGESTHRKYRVDDVTAKIISEVELLYSQDGKLIVNHKDAFRKIILEHYPSSEDFHADWVAGNKLDINNYFEERGIDFSKFYESVGQDVDLYDIILMVAYDKDAKLKIERVNDIKESAVYQSLEDKLRPIIDELLNIYIKVDVFAIERKDVLKLSNFNKFGGMVKIGRLFGGKGEYCRDTNEN